MSPRELAPYKVREIVREDGSKVYEVSGKKAGPGRHRKLFTSKAQAERMRAKWQRDRDLELAGLKEAIGQTTRWQDAFAEYIADAEQRLTHKTVVQTRKAVTEILTMSGATTLGDIDHAAVRRWRTGRSRDAAAGTVNQELSKLRTFLRWCVRERLLASDPLAELEGAKGPKVREAAALSEEQLARILDAAPRLDIGAIDIETGRARETEGFPRLLTLRFLLLVGCRWNEMTKLSWGDFHRESATLRFHSTTTKTKRTRTFPVAGELARVLDEARAAAARFHGRVPRARDPILQSPQGRRWQRNGHRFRAWFYRVLDAAGVDRVNERGEVIHVHALRHSWATRMLLSGVSISKVAALGGWTQIQTLQRIYAHVKANDARDEVAAVSLPLVGDLGRAGEVGDNLEATPIHVYTRDAGAARKVLLRAGFTLPSPGSIRLAGLVTGRGEDPSGDDSSSDPNPGGRELA